MTAANIGFSRDLFPFEAERIFAATASAIENGDKSELRNLVTEKYYSALKKQLPEKRRGAQKVTVATAGSSMVQARRVALTRCPATRPPAYSCASPHPPYRPRESKSTRKRCERQPRAC